MRCIGGTLSKLEAWQRYRKATPCPVCGGYGAYKPENRCKGFLTADRTGAWCSQVGTGSYNEQPLWFEAIGMYMYFHPFEGEGEQVGRHWYRGRIMAMRLAGWNREAAREIERRRPPTGKDFG
jgi:hypothetical protein